MANVPLRISENPPIDIWMYDLGDGKYSLTDPEAESGGGGGTEFAEDAAHVSGALGSLVLAVRKDAAASTAGTDGDYSAFVTDASGRLWVNVGALPAEATETIAWGPRAHDSYVPGYYNELAANTEEATAIPTTPDRPKSFTLWFEESTTSETLKGGRFAFADNGGDVGSITGSDTLLAYHPPTVLEYPIPDWATHVIVAASAVRVAKGAWNYE